MEDVLLEVEEMVTDEVIEGVTEALETVEVPLDFEIDIDVVEDTLSEYSKGALHASAAISAGFGMFKLLKNRKKIKANVATFVKKNKEAIKEMKWSAKPEVVEAEVIEPK